MTKVHATCVAIKGRGVLITGRSGAGKSDLALRLIDRGAALVSDDYTELRVEADRLFASPPETIAGKIEVCGLGIIDMPFVTAAHVHLAIDLDTQPERFPLEPLKTEYLGISLALVRLNAHEASAPIKVEYAVELYGQ